MYTSTEGMLWPWPLPRQAWHYPPPPPGTPNCVLYLSHVMRKPVNNKGANQPVHPGSLVCVCIVHCLDSIAPTVNLLLYRKFQLQLASVIERVGFLMTWLKTFLPYVNNKGADQPAHPRSLIGTFVVRYLDSIIPILVESNVSSL